VYFYFVSVIYYEYVFCISTSILFHRFFSLDLPMKAKTHATRFRFWQPRNGGMNSHLMSTSIKFKHFTDEIESVFHVFY